MSTLNEYMRQMSAMQAYRPGRSQEEFMRKMAEDQMRSIARQAEQAQKSNLLLLIEDQ